MGPFRAAVVQMTPVLGDVDANFARHERGVREARALDADVVIFPELSLTGYFLKDLVPEVARRRQSDTMRHLAAISKGLGLVVGFVEETEDARFCNAAAWFEDGQLRHVYRKVYLPTYGLFDEGRYLARGDSLGGFASAQGPSAVRVCEDLWHPSTVQVAALGGAWFVVAPSSSPLRGLTDDREEDDNARYWERLNTVHAQTWGLFVVYANRVGFEDGVGFSGGSHIVGPDGRVLVRAKSREEDLIVAHLDPAAVRRQRMETPLLRDENLDLTIRELERVRAWRAGDDETAG